MSESKSNVRPYALALAILSGLARLLPHPPNFTPVGSSSLFAGARVSAWYAYLLPIAVMALTDPFLGGYSSSTPFVYISLLLNVLIGRQLVRNNNPVRIGAAATLCSAQFFLISNFSSFLALYPHTMAGLSACYLAAIPFFGRTLLGDLAWTAAIFGLYYALTRTVARHERQLAVA